MAPRGRRFEPHRRHCVVSLSKTHLSLLSTGSTQEDPSRHNCKIVDLDVKTQIKQKKSSSRTLPSLFKVYPLDQKWPFPGVHMFYIGLYRENMKQSYDMYVTSSTGFLPNLFKLCPTTWLPCVRVKLGNFGQ